MKVTLIILFTFHVRLLQKFLDFGYFLWNSLVRRHTPVPRIDDDVLLLPASVLAEDIRTRKRSSVEVLSSFKRRILVVDPILNCVIADRFAAALKEAAEVDSLLDENPNATEISRDKKPILGVPFTAKESIAIQGLPNASALVALTGFIAESDADVVERLREAGGIPIACTAVPELCMWWETNSKVYGRTRNVYDTRRIVGGSSGGEGATISAAGSVWGIGSDIGGSIRLPAFFNGIFGHKPSRRIVPNKGQFPGDPLDDDLNVTGPMCRYACDLIPMLKIMAGKENSSLLKLDQPIDLNRPEFQLAVYSVPDDGGGLGVSALSGEQRDVQRKVEEFLRKGGADVKVERIEDFKATLTMWKSSLAMTGSPSFRELMGKPSTNHVNPVKELFKWFLGLSEHTLPAISLGLTEVLDNTTLSFKQGYASKGKALEEKINQMLGENGIMLYPSNADYAYYHNQPVIKSMTCSMFTPCVYTLIFNVLGFPVTQVPLGLGRKGVPFGIQVVASHNNDRLCIAVAQMLEKEFGGWVDPSCNSIN